MTSSPRSAALAASSAEKYTWPTAAPGEAASPFVRTGWPPPANCGMEHLVDVLCGDAADGFFSRQIDRPFLRHVDGHLQRRSARALSDTRLEHPELALLDGELGVAHVAVVVLEPGEYPHQLLVDGGESALQLGQGLGVADAGDDVLSLRVHEEVAVLAFVACGRVAGESRHRCRNARRGYRRPSPGR